MPTNSAQTRRLSFRLDWRIWLARLEQWPTWRLFLGALLLGLMLSLPWQCARQFGAGKGDVLPTAPGGAAVAGTQAPTANTSTAASILGMPAPSATGLEEGPLIELPGATDPAQATETATEAVAPIDPSTTVEASAAIAVYSPAPEYPATAMRSRDEGTVTVRVSIDSAGMPLHIEIEKSSHSRALDRAAVDALRKWRFTPALAQGVAVESSLVIPISFKSETDH